MCLFVCLRPNLLLAGVDFINTFTSLLHVVAAQLKPVEYIRDKTKHINPLIIK